MNVIMKDLTPMFPARFELGLIKQDEIFVQVPQKTQ